MNHDRYPMNAQKRNDEADCVPTTSKSLPQPSLIHWASSFLLIVSGSIIGGFAAYMAMTTDDYFGFIVIAAAFCFLLSFSQLIAILWRFAGLAYTSAFVWLSLVPIVPLALGYDVKTLITSPFTLLFLFFCGVIAITNLIWAARLDAAGVTRTWIRRVTLAELFAMLTGTTLAIGMLAAGIR